MTTINYSTHLLSANQFIINYKFYQIESDGTKT